MQQQKSQYGFSLVELSIVLLVVGLLLGTTITGLSDFIWHARYAAAHKELAVIEQALVGYTLSNGGLPCPDTDGYPGNPAAADGLLNDAGGGNCDGIVGTGASGFLPWADLGLSARDPWETPYLYRVDINYAKPPSAGAGVAFSLTTGVGSINVTGDNVADNIVAIFFSVGPNGYTVEGDTPSASEKENLDNNDDTFVDRIYSGPDTGALQFDDIMHWLSSYVLKARMTEAKLLP
jgi:prepilin-type N-terminal cleavage/methylation domain-containing protein